jgi:outer membrane protein OmpA-like peptidoglycan-associated protein
VTGTPPPSRPAGWCTDGTWKLSGGGCSSAGGALAPLALLALLPLRRRRGRGAALVALLATAAAPAAARAGDTTDKIDIQRFDPSGGRHDLLGVPSARLAEDLDGRFEIFTDYASSPLQYAQQSGTGSGSAIPVDAVKSLATATLAGTLGIENWVELSAAIPFAIGGSGEPITSVDPRLPSGTPTAGFGDVHLTPKVALMPRDRPFAVALAVPLTIPAGSTPYLSGGAFVASPRIAFETGSLGGWRVLADVGATLRKPTSYAGSEIGSAVAYGLGAEVPFASGRMSVLATLNGEFGKPEDRPLEALAALRWRGHRNFSITVGGGPGLSDAFGTPKLRVFAAVGANWFGGPSPEETYRPPKIPWSSTGASGAPAVSAMGAMPANQGPAAAAAAGLAAVEAAAAPRTASAAPRAAEADRKVSLRNDRITLLEPMQFAPGRDEVAPASSRLLDDLAATLKEHPEIAKLRIEVHTDDDGLPDQLLAKSRRRAGAIREALQARGIPITRLEARGYGDTRPITSNYSDRDRALNRRVELVVVKRPAPLVPATPPP